MLTQLQARGRPSRSKCGGVRSGLAERLDRAPAPGTHTAHDPTSMLSCMYYTLYFMVMRVLGPCGGAAQLPAHAPCAAAPVPPLRSALRCLDITQSGCTLATCLALQCHHRTVGSRAMAAWTSLTLIVPMPLGTRARGHFLSFPLYNLRNADRTREIGNREVHPARAGRLLFIRVSDDEAC